MLSLLQYEINVQAKSLIHYNGWWLLCWWCYKRLQLNRFVLVSLWLLLFQYTNLICKFHSFKLPFEINFWINFKNEIIFFRCCLCHKRYSIFYLILIGSQQKRVLLFKLLIKFMSSCEISKSNKSKFGFKFSTLEVLGMIPVKLLWLWLWIVNSDILFC